MRNYDHEPESWQEFYMLRDELEELLQERRRLAYPKMEERKFPDMSAQEIQDRIEAICLKLHGNTKLP